MVLPIICQRRPQPVPQIDAWFPAKRCPNFREVTVIISDVNCLPLRGKGHHFIASSESKIGKHNSKILKADSFAAAKVKRFSVCVFGCASAEQRVDTIVHKVEIA